MFVRIACSLSSLVFTVVVDWEGRGSPSALLMQDFRVNGLLDFDVTSTRGRSLSRHRLASCPKLALSPLTDAPPNVIRPYQAHCCYSRTPGSPYELRDAQVRGLILRVQPSGHKAWIVTWVHGKRRTLGSVEHLALDQARDQARQAVAEYVRSGLPTLAKSKPTSCTLETLLNDHFEPWAVAELKGGRQYPDRIRSVFPWLLRRQIIEIDVPTIERWWRGRVTGPDAVTKATAARDFACLRSALSRAVEWKLIETNPLLGMRQRSAASRKVVRFLSPDEEAMLRAALAARDLAGLRGGQMPTLLVAGIGNRFSPTCRWTGMSIT